MFTPQRVLSAPQVEEWNTRGFCVVDVRDHDCVSSEGWVLSKEEAASFRIAARTATLGNGEDVQPLQDQRNFGGLGFPFFGRGSEPLNDLALHPRILGAAKQLLKLPVDETPVLSQAECWVKRTRTQPESSSSVPPEYVNADQRMHCDFPNHYLTIPPPWNAPEAVALIVYLDDFEECGGATACVPRMGSDDPAYVYPPVHMPGFGDIPWINDRRLAEDYLELHHPEAYHFRKQLYKREEEVSYRIGTILFYRLDLWHRGTPLTINKDRAVVNILFRTSAATHITSWHRGWAQNAYNAWGSPRTYPPKVGEFENLLCVLNPDQRSALGIPKPGHTFWTYQTIQAMIQRFPTMDMKPYRLLANL